MCLDQEKQLAESKAQNEDFQSKIEKIQEENTETLSQIVP